MILGGNPAHGSTHGNHSTLSAGEYGLRVDDDPTNYSRGTRRNPCLLRYTRHGQTDESSISWSFFAHYKTVVHLYTVSQK